MAQSLNVSFLLDNAPSEEYRLQLEQLLKPSKTRILKNRFRTIMSFVSFIEKECTDEEWDDPIEPKVYGSFVRQFFESVYADPTETEYSNITSHDIDICVFPNSSYDTTRRSSSFLKMIDKFKLLILSKDDKFLFNRYKIISLEDKTIRRDRMKDTDSSGRKLLYNIPHYEVVLENDEDDQIHIDLLAYPPNRTDDTYSLWNNDYDVNSMCITRRGISTHSKESSFFEVQHSIMDRRATSLYPFEEFVERIKMTGRREEKVRLYNQLIHFIVYRTKILDDGYENIYSDTKFLSLSVENEEACSITDAPAPYIKVRLECQHELSIMALASIVNVRASKYTEAISCPFCRERLLPLLIEKKPPKIEVPTFSKIDFSNPEKVRPLEKKKTYMTEENIARISGLLQGLNTQEIEEKVERVANRTERNPRNGYRV